MNKSNKLVILNFTKNNDFNFYNNYKQFIIDEINYKNYNKTHKYNSKLLEYIKKFVYIRYLLTRYYHITNQNQIDKIIDIFRYYYLGLKQLYYSNDLNKYNKFKNIHPSLIINGYNFKINNGNIVKINNPQFIKFIKPLTLNYISNINHIKGGEVNQDFIFNYYQLLFELILNSRDLSKKYKEAFDFINFIYQCNKSKDDKKIKINKLKSYIYSIFLYLKFKFNDNTKVNDEFIKNIYTDAIHESKYKKSFDINILISEINNQTVISINKTLLDVIEELFNNPVFYYFNVKNILQLNNLIYILRNNKINLEFDINKLYTNNLEHVFNESIINIIETYFKNIIKYNLQINDIVRKINDNKKNVTLNLLNIYKTNIMSIKDKKDILYKELTVHINKILKNIVNKFKQDLKKNIIDEYNIKLSRNPNINDIDKVNIINSLIKYLDNIFYNNYDVIINNITKNIMLKEIKDSFYFIYNTMIISYIRVFLRSIYTLKITKDLTSTEILNVLQTKVIEDLEKNKTSDYTDLSEKEREYIIKLLDIIISMLKDNISINFINNVIKYVKLKEKEFKEQMQNLDDTIDDGGESKRFDYEKILKDELFYQIKNMIINKLINTDILKDINIYMIRDETFNETIFEKEITKKFINKYIINEDNASLLTIKLYDYIYNSNIINNLQLKNTCNKFIDIKERLPDYKLTDLNSISIPILQAYNYIYSKNYYYNDINKHILDEVNNENEELVNYNYYSSKIYYYNSYIKGGEYEYLNVDMFNDLLFTNDIINLIRNYKELTYINVDDKKTYDNFHDLIIE